MTAFNAVVWIRSLRLQLEVLEARLRASQPPERHTLADLRGILRQDMLTTVEEIDAVKYGGKAVRRGKVG